MSPNVPEGRAAFSASLSNAGLDQIAAQGYDYRPDRARSLLNLIAKIPVKPRPTRRIVEGSGIGLAEKTTATFAFSVSEYLNDSQLAVFVMSSGVPGIKSGPGNVIGVFISI